MITTKTITNTIYFIGLIAVVILDYDNFEFYYGLVFVTIQIIFIVASYISANRTFSAEALLIKKYSLITAKDLFLVIPFIIVIFLLTNFFMLRLSTAHLLMYIGIGVLSAVLQFLIIRNKKVPTFIIDDKKLIVNDLFKKTYNLEILTSIDYNEFNDVYIVDFANAGKLKIKQEDFKLDDLNNFFLFMTTKSNYNVLLSDNIKDEITAANN